jgi:hypothetical protein
LLVVRDKTRILISVYQPIEKRDAVNICPLPWRDIILSKIYKNEKMVEKCCSKLP